MNDCLASSNRAIADGAGYASVIVRSPLDHTVVSGWLRKEIAGLDPALPVQINSMDLRIRNLQRQPRFNAYLLTTFAATGILLAVIGLYGITAFLVGQREKEIGVRVALGAAPRAIMGLVLSEAARWTLFGIVLGSAGSLFAARLIRTLLFEVPANDYLGLGISLIGVFGVAILAAFIPSRRAALTDPLLALRQE